MASGKTPTGTRDRRTPGLRVRNDAWGTHHQRSSPERVGGWNCVSCEPESGVTRREHVADHHIRSTVQADALARSAASARRANRQSRRSGTTCRGRIRRWKRCWDEAELVEVVRGVRTPHRSRKHEPDRIEGEAASDRADECLIDEGVEPCCGDPKCELMPAQSPSDCRRGFPHPRSAPDVCRRGPVGNVHGKRHCRVCGVGRVET